MIDRVQASTVINAMDTKHTIPAITNVSAFVFILF